MVAYVVIVISTTQVVNVVINKRTFIPLLFELTLGKADMPMRTSEHKPSSCLRRCPDGPEGFSRDAWVRLARLAQSAHERTDPIGGAQRRKDAKTLGGAEKLGCSHTCTHVSSRKLA